MQLWKFFNNKKFSDLQYGYQVSYFNSFPVHIHYHLYFIFSKFCCAGMMKSVQEILCRYNYFIKHAHRDYPAT